MKIIVLIIVMMILLTFFSFGIDFLLGFDATQAVDDWIKPFLAMTTAEKLIFILYPLLILLHPILSRFQKKKQNGNE